MFSKIIRLLAGQIEKPATPKYGDWRVDPNHPANLGWQRSDVDSSARPVRFRLSVGNAPKAVPPPVPTTGFGFVSTSDGHVDHHAEPPKQATRPVPSRTGIPQAPRADSTFWTRTR